MPNILIKRPALHAVGCDHGLTVFTALEKARERGDRKPGLAIAHRPMPGSMGAGSVLTWAI